jgi:hypothetical protein
MPIGGIIAATISAILTGVGIVGLLFASSLRLIAGAAALVAIGVLGLICSIGALSDWLTNRQKSPVIVPPKIDQKTSEELLQKRMEELELIIQKEVKQAAEAVEASKKKEEEDKKIVQEFEDLGHKKLLPIDLSIFARPTSKTGLELGGQPIDQLDAAKEVRSNNALP